MHYVARVEVVAIEQSPDEYDSYIFRDLDNKFYVWATVLPNWNMKVIPRLNDIGYLKYKIVEAGDDVWYDIATGTKIPYKYDECYFEDFVLEKKPTEDLTL